MKNLENVINEISLREMASKGLHEFIAKLLSNFKRGKLLDVPSGQGSLSFKLKALGFQVYAADYGKEVFEIKDISFQWVDLNSELPFESEFFGYVVCVEGIEHLWYPKKCIQEFSRILKLGGILVLTTPNILSISNRLRFFCLGYFGGFNYNENAEKMGHFSSLSFLALNYILKKAGFEVKLTTHVIQRWHKFFLFVFYPFIKLFSKIFSEKEISNLTSNRKILFGDPLMIIAEKGKSNEIPHAIGYS